MLADGLQLGTEFTRPHEQVAFLDVEVEQGVGEDLETTGVVVVPVCYNAH